VDASNDGIGNAPRLELTVVTVDAQVFYIEGIAGDELVRVLVAEVFKVAYPDVTWRVGRLVADLVNDDGQTRLDPNATLLEAGVRDHSQIYIGTETSGGGFGLPELVTFVGGMVLSGAVGNAGYDLLKATCKSISEHWSNRNRLLSRRRLRASEAVGLAQAAACLRFDIDDPDRLRLDAARPIVLRYDHEGIRVLKTKRFASRRGTAKSWSCVFSLCEEGLPASMTIVVQANPPDPERTFIYLLPDKDPQAASRSSPVPRDG
jgi:hypothetical protein